MIWLIPLALTMPAAYAVAWWLGRHVRLVWRYGPPEALRATVTATVVRPIPSPRPVPGRPAASGVQARIIRGEVER